MSMAVDHRKPVWHPSWSQKRFIMCFPDGRPCVDQDGDWRAATEDGRDWDYVNPEDSALTNMPVGWEVKVNTPYGEFFIKCDARGDLSVRCA